MATADLLEQGDPVHRHHAYVTNDQRHGLHIQQAQRLLPARCGQDSLPRQLQRVAYRFAQVRVVLDDQYW